MSRELLRYDGERVALTDPLSMPRASAFLWNPRMMIQLDCRGFAVAQHLQPEPSRYSHAPLLEARSFMQPEQPRYAHHPGRFVFIKDEESGEIFSVPHEPVRRRAPAFEFSVGPSDIRWLVSNLNLEVAISVSLPLADAVELWTLRVRNTGSAPRRVSVYPFFSIGYMSWMNQSAAYRPDLGGVVASSVTPYQKIEEYETVRQLKDRTCLLHDTPPTAWEASLQAFEGEGGLHNPDGVQRDLLGNGDASYELPTAVLQYRFDFEPEQLIELRFLFGPARSDDEIRAMREKYLATGGFERAAKEYRAYMDAGKGCLEISTPDAAFDHFVNHWLARQVDYQGQVNRLTTDPQTRNFLQDAMGMTYVRPTVARAALLHALTQQKASGALPDGILMNPAAELKYINQVPHSDHCAWLPIFVQAYLDETADYALLDETVVNRADGSESPVHECVTRAMRWLIRDRDARGLNFIAQGDWCDPMNGVGFKGLGVSAWLSMATIVALRCWADVCIEAGREDTAEELRHNAEAMAAAVQQHFWDGEWFARGITDDGIVFGVSTDGEGRIFLNPQSWSLLAGIASEEQRERMFRAIEAQLEGPHGVAVLAPAYTKMREDVGRLTQKFPGTAENGSVYNHAAAFYVYALGTAGHADHAYRLLRLMIPGPEREGLTQREQLPVFIPNYYRGAWRESPRTAGRSSQLVHTGTVSWFYRILIDSLFGLRGCRQGLKIQPNLPSIWQEARVVRSFRGARFDVRFRRCEDAAQAQVTLNGVPLTGCIITDFEAGGRYEVDVVLAGAPAQAGC